VKPYGFDTERKGTDMRSELAILAIWVSIYMAIMMLAMFLTAVGFHMLH
jgi:hypothetical protein